MIHDVMVTETHAVDLVPEGKRAEPTRSILYRSAASFAYQAGAYAEAERLIFKGLAGYPATRYSLLRKWRFTSDYGVGADGSAGGCAADFARSGWGGTVETISC